MRIPLTRSSVGRIVALTTVGIGFVITVIAYSNHRRHDESKLGESDDSMRRKLVPYYSKVVSDTAIEIKAAEFLRFTFNSYRKANCKAAPLFTEDGEIHSVLKLSHKNRSVEYSMEVSFGESTFYAKLAIVSSTNSFENQTTFKFLRSAPGPCESSMHDQLAISSKAIKAINAEKLTWTARLNPEHLGKQVKSFGRGYVPLSDEQRKALLLRLLGSWQTESSLSDRNGSSAHGHGHHRALLADSSALYKTNSTGRVGTTNAPTISSSNAAAKTQTTPLPLQSTPPPSFTPPVGYDARDVYPGQTPCKAFEPLDQGPCNSCYAFATAAAFGARVCRAYPGTVGNVVVSPQQVMDCTNGCNGGSELDAYQSLVNHPGVELWCDPYTQSQGACGGVCGASNAFGVVPRSVRQVGGAGAYGILQMQMELVQGGPGVMSLTVLNDLFAYAGGVYTPSATAQVVGGHAVSLVGWGVDNGVPYWTLQNSWGKGWGEGGFFRIARGVDSCGIESTIGLVVARPAPPAGCPASSCSPGSTTLSDCSCKCAPGRTGPTCAQCALTCLNGGVRDANCTKCSCPRGFYGPLCEGGYALAPLASCLQDNATRIAVSYSFGGSMPPPTRSSFVGLFALTETGPFKSFSSASICGGTYNASANGGLCPSAGTFSIARPTVAGQYKIVVVPYSPPNALGLDGYYNLRDSNIIGLYTLLPSGCSAQSLAAAKLGNDPVSGLAAAINASAVAQATAQAAMNARLNAVQPLLAALRAEPPASVTFVGLNASAPSSVPVVWMGIPGVICFRIPSYANINPKALIVYIGDGSSGVYYPNALGVGSQILPAGSQGCVNFSLSRGIPVGMYTVALEDSSNGRAFAAVSLNAVKAALKEASFALASGFASVGLSWSMPGDQASVTDAVWARDSRGNVVYWFYTSCKCKTNPGPVPAINGTYALKVFKPAVPGGYRFELHPGNGSAIATVASDWIPWSNFGW